MGKKHLNKIVENFLDTIFSQNKVVCTLKNLKIIHLEKERFIKVSELKLYQIELFSLFHFKSIAPNVTNCFVCPFKQLMNFFHTILTFHFKLQITHPCKLASLS